MKVTKNNVTAITFPQSKNGTQKVSANVYAAAGDINEHGEIIGISLKGTKFGEPSLLWNTTIYPVQLQDIVVEPGHDRIYAIGKGQNNDNLYVINGSTAFPNNTKPEIARIENAINDPDHMAIDLTKREIYITQASSNKVRVINISKVDDKINDSVTFGEPGINANQVNDTDLIPTDTNPRGIAINPDTHRVYVANMGSGTVSIIDVSNDNAKAIYKLSIKTNPLNAGEISCSKNRMLAEYDQILEL